MKITLTLSIVALALNVFANDVVMPAFMPVGFTVASGTTKVLTVTATNTLTFSGNAADGETVTIGPKVYTFKTTITNADGQVLIGTNSASSATNLVLAITLGAGAGTNYATNMTAQGSVTASSVNATNVLISALAVGPAGNAIPVSDTVALAGFPFQNTTLVGGSSIEAPILPMNGLGVEITLVGTNATIGNSSNVVCNFALTGGGTNFATAAPGIFSVNVVPNGKTNATVFTNLPVTLVANARKVRFVSCQNQDTNSTITVLAVPITTSASK